LSLSNIFFAKLGDQVCILLFNSYVKLYSKNFHALPKYRQKLQMVT